MGVLIRTFLEIALLRKGPEAIPASWLLFTIAVLLRYAVIAISIGLIDELSFDGSRVEFVFWLLSLFCYGSVVVLAGKTARLAPALTAIAGIGAVIVFVQVVVFQVGVLVVSGDRVVPLLEMLQIWSVVVKGHIIARAVQWHWYAGLLVSLGIFFFLEVVRATTFAAG